MQKNILYRYSQIIRKLQSKKYVTLKDIEAHLLNKEREDGVEIGFSERTWDRDKNALQELCNIEIKYSHQYKGYYIEEEESLQSESFMRILEAFEVFNAFNLSQDLKNHIDLNQRRSQGTENLYILMHCIKNKVQISYMYQKFGSTKPQKYTLSPYMLKEFKNRWYVIGKNTFDEQVKTFSLDRLSQVEVHNQHFELPKDFDPQQFFKHSFGIITPKDEKLETIILSFDPFQGKYIKTMPLHHTQKILMDNEEELRVSVELYPTHDFKMEILSMAGNVKVISPQSFAKEIKNDLQEALENYK